MTPRLPYDDTLPRQKTPASPEQNNFDSIRPLFTYRAYRHCITETECVYCAVRTEHLIQTICIFIEIYINSFRYVTVCSVAARYISKFRYMSVCRQAARNIGKFLSGTVCSVAARNYGRFRYATVSCVVLTWIIGETKTQSSLRMH
jgi:hypothetical protein